MRGDLIPRRWAFVCVLTLPLLFSCRMAEPRDRVCFPGACYDVELALTPETRQRGLQRRVQMPADHGMLFVFPKSSAYGFWMKETLIPLDMIWMDHNRRIVHIEEHVPPCETTAQDCPVYTPPKPALYVLELNAGQAAEKRLKIGLTAVFHLSPQPPADKTAP
ncbi:MAG TPA: DUF192 domain-containing protein [Candidatus Omnitrophota bacterium]|nr:DUF192 domain-containing protein [Candidatus Omnitrophota bacterium]HPB69188.1 DUF192 domain-containing protein [Candidatus Omnitrophota bacterium]HQO57190.1 DUF192 domain-containing protein [Candidatus Omnitrophota bacterium]HQP11984.1 DUF192 domain-containing protein [Candidatus Omnitrophota bacterium]